MRRLFLLCLAGIACAAAVAPTPSHAGTVTHAPGFARLLFTASPGEANRVTVTSAAGTITVADPGAGTLTPLGDCTTVAADTASCPAAAITELDLSGGDGDDQITNQTSVGGELLGEDGNDILRGGAAAERLDGGAGADTLDGGGGDDRLYGATLQNPDAGSEPDQLTGGPGNDWIFGSGGPDHADGGSGDDQLSGGSGDDELRAGDGADSIIGGSGTDFEDGGPGNDAVGTETTLGVVETSQEQGNDTLLGGPGNDTLAPGPGPSASDADTISGGDGFDSVSYAPRANPVSVSKDAAADDGEPAEGDKVEGDVESITGGLANDSLRGGPDADTLVGGPGDDEMEGLAGDDDLQGDGGLAAGTDTMSGGAGNDRIQGQAGGDMLAGGAGSDTLEGGTSDDTLSGGSQQDRLVGGPDEDTVAYSTAADVTVRLGAGRGGSTEPGDIDRLEEVEDVSGGNQRDTVTGTNAPNVLDGANGEDYIDGRRGVDRLDGGGSADVVAARDGVRDAPVACGPGQDFAIVDRRDRVVRSGKNRCEQVDDGTQTRPRPGRVHVAPQRCPKPEDNAELGLPAMHRLVPLRYSIMLNSGYRGRAAPWFDATDCPVLLSATPGKDASASAHVSGAAAQIAQTLGRRVDTVLTVVGPKCARGGRTLVTERRPPRLRVDTRRGHGRWKVRGKHSIGAAYGTDWTTVENCSRTTTIVRRGRVRVYDRTKHRTIIVRAGHQYVARAPG
jgi:Ca2+-binding RTX toxin-like protein